MSRTDGAAADGHAGGDNVAVAERGLADRLGELARALEHERDTAETLSAIVRAAVQTVPGAGHASISVIRRRREVETRAASDEVAVAADLAQYESGQGPCLDALYEQQTVRLPDVRAEHRWPSFTQRAQELGLGSMLAVQLFVDDDDLGALNLSSPDPRAFDEESEHVAHLFAAHAAVAMASAQERDLLRRAVSSRQRIGQAQGILMERFSITEDQAFSLLVSISQDRNRKLTAVAVELVRSGQLPAR